MPTCWHCKTETSAEHYDRVVHNHQLLHGPWSGWRLAGRHLISPDGERLTPERVRGLLARFELEARRARARKSRSGSEAAKTVKVVIVELADYRHQGVAAV